MYYMKLTPSQTQKGEKERWNCALGEKNQFSFSEKAGGGKYIPLSLFSC